MLFALKALFRNVMSKALPQCLEMVELLERLLSEPLTDGYDETFDNRRGRDHRMKFTYLSAASNEGTLVQVDQPHRIYRYPADLRVADFIGNPVINFADADCSEHNGMLRLESKLGTMLLRSIRSDFR